jgi:hypothetical protein
MSKYRFKTIEEFKAEDLWINDSYSSSLDGYPNGWCEDGGMNKYLGMDVPDTFNVKMNKNRSFIMDSWTFEPDDYILKEEEPVDITEVIEQVKQLNKNSLTTKKKMATTKNAVKNPVAEKFVFMDKTVSVLNVGFSTAKNVILYGPGE